VLCGLSFGYADKSQAINTYRTTRAKLEEVISWSDE